MIHNYLKTSLRNIKRHKIYTGITTVGLALGITCCLLIMLWIQDELSFDRFHAHAGDIHRVLQEQNFTDHHEIRALTPPPLGPALMSDFPEVLRFSRYTRFVGDVSLAYGEHGFYESGGATSILNFSRSFHSLSCQVIPRRRFQEYFPLS